MDWGLLTWSLSLQSSLPFSLPQQSRRTGGSRWQGGGLGCNSSSPPGPLSEPQLLLQCVGLTKPARQGWGRSSAEPGTVAVLSLVWLCPPRTFPERKSRATLGKTNSGSSPAPWSCWLLGNCMEQFPRLGARRSPNRGWAMITSHLQLWILWFCCSPKQSSQSSPLSGFSATALCTCPILPPNLSRKATLTEHSLHAGLCSYHLLSSSQPLKIEGRGRELL